MGIKAEIDAAIDALPMGRCSASTLVLGRSARPAFLAALIADEVLERPEPLLGEEACLPERYRTLAVVARCGADEWPGWEVFEAAPGEERAA